MNDSVLILGDIHLGKGLNFGKILSSSILNTRVQDQSNLLDWVLEEAIKNNCSNIITTGDVFEESKPSVILLNIFSIFVRKVIEHGINLHLILGNHDMDRIGNEIISPLKLFSDLDLNGVHVYEKPSTFYVNDCSFTLLPFMDRKYFNTNSNQEALDRLKTFIDFEKNSIDAHIKSKVVVGHLALEGCIPIGDEFDDLVNELMCPKDFFNEFDYTWMGHVHNYQKIQKKPYISHIGSMEISNFGEENQKKNIIIFDTIKHSFKEIEIPTRKFRKIKIEIPSDTQDVDKFIEEELELFDVDKSIVAVEIKTTNQTQKFSRQKINASLSKKCHNLATISEIRNFSSIKKNSIDKDNKINKTLSINDAIKKYSDLFIKDEDKSLFLESASGIVKRLKVK